MTPTQEAVMRQALEALEGSIAITMAKIALRNEAITALRAVLAEPQEPLEHLKQYGYAPGNYMSKCHHCGTVADNVDKRAVTCRSCAEALHAARKTAEQEGGGNLPPPLQEPAQDHFPDAAKIE